MKTKIKVIASCAFGVSSIIGCSAMAAGDGWSGTGSDSWGGAKQLSGVSCDNAYRAYDYRVDCTGVSWLKYIPDVEGSEIQVVPRGNGTEYGTAIDTKCAKAGVGFYHLGINFQGVYTPDHYFYNYTSQPGAIGGYVGALNSNFLNHSASINSVYDIDIGTYEYTYRIAADGYWGHRYNTTVGQVGTGSYNTKDPDNGNTMKFGHKLYKNGKQIYHSEADATDPDKMPGFYAAFLNNMCGSGSDGCKEQTDGCSYSGGKWTCSAMPSDVFAFCAYPIEPEGTKLKPQATIKIGTTTVTTDLKYDSSGLSEKTAPGEITVNSSTVSAVGDFDYYIEKAMKTTSFKPPMSVAGASISSPSLYFSGADTHISDGLDDSAKTKNATLEANTKTKVCAETSSPSKISSTSTSGDTLTARACIYVTYVPIITYVHSDTVAMIDSNKLTGSSTQSIFKSGKDGNPGAYSVNVKPGQVDIFWGHNLGYEKKNSGDVISEVWTDTYNIKGGGSLAHKLHIYEYKTPNSFNDHNWRWYITDSTNGNYPSASNKDTSNSEVSGAFPGETKEAYQILKHPKEVYANTSAGGNAVNGSGELQSSVTLNLKADNVQCGIKKGEFNSPDTYMYSIGTEQPYDYRWLGMMRASDGTKLVVGDGDKIPNSANLWLKEDDKITIMQRACFGSQIAVDASNGGEDRFSRNLWTSGTTDNRETDTVHNKQFTLSTGFSDDFFKNGNGTASKMGSHTDQSLRASEIGISDFSKSSTPDSRIQANYMGNAMTTPTRIGNLGKSISTSFAKPNGELVSIAANVPYNYYMTIEGGTKEVLDGTKKTSFEVTLKRNERLNKQVCSGRDEGANCAPYSTVTKPTTANMVAFKLDANFSLGDLEPHREFDVLNNAASADEIWDTIRTRLGAYHPERLKDANNGFSDRVITDSSVGLKTDEFDYDMYPVGTKICAATAVYPSDSHDTKAGESYDVDSADQSVALRTDGNITRYSVTCRTVAKYQTMSVEGNGLATTGTVDSSETTYKNKEFRSWSEYQIIAGASNAGSGAVTAYALGSGATNPYETKASVQQYSVASNSFFYPQSLGNIKQLAIMGGSNSAEEATANWNYALDLKTTIIDTYGVEGNELPVGDYLKYSGGDISVTPFAEGLGKDAVIIRSAKDVTISNDSKLDKAGIESSWGGTKQIIIIGKNININSDVEEVNAWLIVDNGTLNTCAGNQPDYKNPDTKKWDGNQHLLDNCNKKLLINGAVIVDGKIVLPRTYGGGSVAKDDGTLEKDETSYVLRSEIFNYDPRVVKWAYEESEKKPRLVTTYTETLAPRL